jgi:hypothetical protein
MWFHLSLAQNFIAQQKAAWRGQMTTPGGLTKTAKRFLLFVISS